MSTDTRWPTYPALSAEHVQGATLYARRADQIAGLAVAKGGKVAEIGVWRAAFSKVLVDTLKPRQAEWIRGTDVSDVQDGRDRVQGRQSTRTTMTFDYSGKR